MAAWTDNAARLHAKGAIEYGRGNKLTLEDTYIVTMDNGARPLSYDIQYKTGSGSGTIRANVTGMPKRRDRHPDYPCFRASAIRWRQPSPRSRVWEGAVTYEYDPYEEDSSEDAGDVVSIEFGAVSIQTPITTDADGAALKNSAGDPFEPVPMAEISCPTVDIVVDRSTEPASLADYNGAINDSAVTVAGIRFPKHCARVTFTARQLEGEEKEGAVGDRFRYTFHVEGNFSIKPHEDGDQSGGTLYAGWVQYIPDAGWNYIDATTHLKTRATVSVQGGAIEDNPVPVFLNEDGSVKTSGAPRYIKACAYPIKSFSSLHLPAHT